MEVLTSKNAQVAEPNDAAALNLHFLDVSRQGQVDLVEFKYEHEFTKENCRDLRRDFSELAERLERNSKVLLDFALVNRFDVSAINLLIEFRQSIRMKGSRVIMCCLKPHVRQSFFSTSPPNFASKANEGKHGHESSKPSSRQDDSKKRQSENSP